MSSRIREHIRGNLYGIIALFLVLTGGTAQALDGSNTVFSDDIVNGQVRTADLATNAVTSGKLVNGQVTTPDLAANSVTGGTIANGAVANSDLAANAVDSAKVADNTINNADVQNGTINNLDLDTNSVFTEEIRDGEVRTDDLGNSSVNSAKIVNGSVGFNDLALNSVTNTEVVNGSLRGADVGELEVVEFTAAIPALGANECNVAAVTGLPTNSKDHIVLTPDKNSAQWAAVSFAPLYTSEAGKMYIQACNHVSTGIGAANTKFNLLLINAP